MTSITNFGKFGEVYEDIMDLWNQFSMNINDDNQDIYRQILFGRNISRPVSLFELILSTPDMSDLIKKIWDKFDLKKEAYMLKEVCDNI